MRIVTKTIIGLFTLGATGAVVFWRSQQARQTAQRAFDEAKQRLDVAGIPTLSAIKQQAQSGATDQQAAHTDATDQRIAAPSSAMQSISMRSGDATMNGAMVSATRPEVHAEQPADKGESGSSFTESSEENTDTFTKNLLGGPDLIDPVAVDVEMVDFSISDTPQSALESDEPAPTTSVNAAAVSPSAKPAAPTAPSVDATHLSPIAAMSNEEAAKLSGADFAPKNDPDAGELDNDGDDRIIADRVRSHIERELEMSDMPRLNINVQENGILYLRGAVQNATQRALVEQVARNTDGVQNVVNELHVEESMDDIEQTQPTNTETMQNIPNISSKDDPDAGELDADGDDRTTTDRVRSILGRELHTDQLARINVNTQEGGVVYLRGVVHSQEERDRIEHLVGQVKGVGDIVNELHVEQQAGS